MKCLTATCNPTPQKKKKNTQRQYFLLMTKVSVKMFELSFPSPDGIVFPEISQRKNYFEPDPKDFINTKDVIFPPQSVGNGPYSKYNTNAVHWALVFLYRNRVTIKETINTVDEDSDVKLFKSDTKDLSNVLNIENHTNDLLISWFRSLKK